MRTTAPGTTRTLLLAALALAAAVILASFAVFAMKGDAPEDPGETDPGVHPLGGGNPRTGKSKRPKTDVEGEDEPDEPEGGDDGVIEFPGDPRNPSGPEFVVTPDTLRAALAIRHWEEIRRMIDELGDKVPQDVIKELMSMLAKEDLRLDAVLALGGVKDDATGRALAELASSRDADLETRQAALDALAKNGTNSALPVVQQLLASESLDDSVARHAVFALAGIGGPEAAKTLLDLITKHRDDDLSNVLVAALGKAKDVDAGMVQTLRGAESKGDKELTRAVLVAALHQGKDAGPETKLELQRLVESSSALSEEAFPDEVDRQLLQGAAMPAAVAAGIVHPVLRQATTAGPLRDIALNALRQARGDEAAKQIAAALARATDETVRRELTVALGLTESDVATPTLVSLLDDEAPNVRNAAARGLGQIRDASAVKPILARLDKAAPDQDFANALVTALGTIGANEALPKLRSLAASKEAFWVELNPWIRLAINRIDTGNPESQSYGSNQPPK